MTADKSPWDWMRRQLPSQMPKRAPMAETLAELDQPFLCEVGHRKEPGSFYEGFDPCTLPVIWTAHYHLCRSSQDETTPVLWCTHHLSAFILQAAKNIPGQCARCGLNVTTAADIIQDVRRLTTNTPLIQNPHKGK